MSNATRVDVSKSVITLDELRESEFQKEGTITAQLRQVVTTTSWYPSKKVDNDLNGGLFTADDFGFHEQEFESEEQRIAWILVPKGMTAEAVQAKLDAANKVGAVIYRVLSNEPILSEDQQYSIEEGLKTLDDYANSQVLRHPETNEILPDSAGNVQYRKTFFWPSSKADVDMRGTTQCYMSAEIEAELNSLSDTTEVEG